MLVEFLTFRVPAAHREHWMAVEAVTWSEFLCRQAGFRGKQLWVDRDDADCIHAVIVWDDEHSWKSIPEEELRAVDDAMGEFRRDATLRVFDVLHVVPAHTSS